MCTVRVTTNVSVCVCHYQCGGVCHYQCECVCVNYQCGVCVSLPRVSVNIVMSLSNVV